MKDCRIESGQSFAPGSCTFYLEASSASRTRFIHSQLGIRHHSLHPSSQILQKRALTPPPFPPDDQSKPVLEKINTPLSSRIITRIQRFRTVVAEDGNLTPSKRGQKLASYKLTNRIYTPQLNYTRAYIYINLHLSKHPLAKEKMIS